MADDADSAGPESTESQDADDVLAESNPTEYHVQPHRPRVRSAFAAGLIGLVTVAGLAGWLGYRAHDSRHAAIERNQYLQVGRQAALNLTTINYTQAEADVQRILDSSTGTFHDDYQTRAKAFIEVVKQAQSQSVGTIAEAGVVSESDGRADVLVAVTVKTSVSAAREQEPRNWRMRMTVQETDDGMKVSNVEFVP
jgi:Mce-associated membrane protein